MAEQAAPHETSLAVWDVPATVAAGERFAVKVGAKSSAGSALAGRRIEVLDGQGSVVASGSLGDDPWPGTALLFAEVKLAAPNVPGLLPLAVRFDAVELDEPHLGAPASFSVAVVARPEHRLTVQVAAGGVPIAEAYIRLGPYRATTDAKGTAEISMAKGRYQLQVWKAGYDTPATPLDLQADAFVQVEAKPQPDEHPDSVWTA